MGVLLQFERNKEYHWVAIKTLKPTKDPWCIVMNSHQIPKFRGPKIIQDQSVLI
jgi:hypothetical protein